jgi:Tfp pilus assembly protein FimT
MGYYPLKRVEQESGFSLIELLGCISISATLLFSVLPQLNHMLSHSMLESRVSSLYRAIKEAKSAAIKHDSEIVICSLQAQKLLCIDKADDPQIWSQGWIVFEDENSNKLFDNKDRLIQVDRYNEKQCELLWNRGGHLSYHSFGVLKGARAGSFKISCGKLQTHLVINWIGRIRRKS